MEAASIAPWVQLGFAAWVGYYLLSKAMPRMEKRAEERDTKYIDSTERIVSRFEAQMQLQREHDERQTERLEDALWGRVSGNGRDRSGP